MPDKKNILVCPLDWGLGHATRCVPVIQEFLNLGVNVIIAADKRPLAFLKKEFPALTFITFPGYDITYPEKGIMAVKMLFSLPRIFRGIRKEKKFLQKIITEYNIDVVISDNRYGLWNKSVKCIFITHQLSVQIPGWLKFFEYFAMQLNKHYIKKYDECWVPDLQGRNNLSGELSAKHKDFHNVYFIGLLSRFRNYRNKFNDNKIKYDIIFILSGPEPQRTVFENIVLEQLKKNNHLKAIIVRGITESTEEKYINENIKIVNHLKTDQLAQAILESALVICRPGYSSIMDLITLGRNAVFVPTPGQTEQEYLSKLFRNKILFYSVSQRSFSLHKVIEKAAFYGGLKIDNDNNCLRYRIKALIK